jgi:hypothetical protein
VLVVLPALVLVVRLALVRVVLLVVCLAPVLMLRSRWCRCWCCPRPGERVCVPWHQRKNAAKHPRECHQSVPVQLGVVEEALRTTAREICGATHAKHA